DAPDLDVLRSGYLPSVSEDAALASNIATIDILLATIDTELGTLEERLEALRRDRTRLMGDKQAMQCLRAPIRRLPVELLRPIIREALPPKWYIAPCGSVRLPLAETCLRLRTIAHATPELWSTLVLPDIYKHRARTYFVEASERYVERANGMPLELLQSNFDSNYRRWDDDDSWLNAQMERLTNMQLLRSIDWYLPATALKESSISAPLLERARLVIPRGTYAPKTLSRSFFTFNAPELRSLMLTRWLAPSCVVAPWSQLISLTLATDTMGDDDLRAVRLCTALRSLHLNIRRYPAINRDSPAVHLGSLRELALNEWGHIVCPYILAPHLTVLSTDHGNYEDSDPEWYSICVEKMLQRHPLQDGHSLQFLTMRVANSVDVLRDTLAVLRCAPTIKHLALIYARLYDKLDSDDGSLLRTLVQDPDVVPLLEHLTIDIGTYGTSDADIVRKLALSRWGDGEGRRRGHLTLRARCRANAVNYFVKACHCATRAGTWQSDLQAHGILVEQPSC
ncbi:hypothetical protein BD626DRAFT_375224, partial [Schizophyllum amplum]